jgi:hypothetical protein
MIDTSLTGDMLMEQACMTAEHYMIEAIKRIDVQFGNGTAKQHPELVAAFMQAAAFDCGTALIGQQLRSIAVLMEEHR